MVAARAVTARPGPTEAASADVSAAARPASPALAPAKAMPMITAPRRTPSGSRACWTGGLGFRVGPSDGGSRSASSKGRNCLVELIEIAW
jgi:hypothetical protein